MDFYVHSLTFEDFKTKCVSIEIHNHRVDEAMAGDIVGINIKGVNIRDILNDLAFEEKAFIYIKKAENIRVKVLKANKNMTLKVGSIFFNFFVI